MADWGKIASIAIPAAVGAGSAYVASRSNRKDREAAEEQAALDREAREGTNLMEVASRESLADPFRHQNNQASSLAMLDRIANAQRGKTQIAVPPEMQRFVPQISGGYSYEASPDLREAAKRMQRDVASGRGAPSMTNPANYGTHGGLDLNDPASIGRPSPMAPAPAGGPIGSGAVPRHGSGAAGVQTGASIPALSTRQMIEDADDGTGLDMGGTISRQVTPWSGEGEAPRNQARGYQLLDLYDDPYERRNEGAGGAGKGALQGASWGSMAGPVGAGVGAIVGGIAGAATKNAKTAVSDFAIGDVEEIYRTAYRDMFGRDITDEALDEVMRGQGWEPGDEWGGQDGLAYVLDQWYQAAAREGRGRRAPAASEDLEASYSGLFA